MMKIASLFALLCLFSCGSGYVVTSTDLLLCVGQSQCILDNLAFLNTIQNVQFSSSTFLNLNINLGATTFVFGNTKTIGALIIDAGVAARVTVSGTLTTTSNSASAALQVGAQAAVNVTGALIVQGNAVVDGAINVIGSTSSNTRVTVSGSMTSSSSSSASSSSGVYVSSSASITVSGEVNLNKIITVASNGFFNFAGNFTSQANTTVYGTIASTATTTAQAATYFQTAAVLSLQNAVGVVSATHVRIQNSAYFTGNGNITGNLYIEGSATVAVGNSPGTSYVRGDYRMSSTSSYTCDIGSETNYDRLIIFGTAYLDGYAIGNLENNYVPAKTTSFNTLTFTSSSGNFQFVRGNSITTLTSFSGRVSGTGFAIIYNSAATVACSAFLLVASLLVSLVL